MIIKVEVSFTIRVDSDRNLDLTNPVRWNLLYTDPDTGESIIDTDLTMPKEKAFSPKIKITKLMGPYEPED